MSDEEEECPPCPAGLPAWLATFADLMSLLMCFFVLLLSFSELDAIKFKRLAGELRNAYGVQTLIQVEDPPKGTSVIARHFSPSIPEPTPIDEIRQKTSDITKSSLEVLCQDEVTQQEEAQGDSGKQTRDVTIQQSQTVEDTPKATEEQAMEIAAELDQEVAEGQVELETQGKKIVIRIRENGAFRPGSAYVQDRFLPIIDKIRQVLVSTPGRISVEGHTDNIPIRSNAFRSNWSLSAARAVAFAEELFIAPELDESRFMIVGHADARPLTDNDTPENRARNRRVELVILQEGENDDDDQPELDSNSPQYDGQLNTRPEDYELSPDDIF